MFLCILLSFFAHGLQAFEHTINYQGFIVSERFYVSLLCKDNNYCMTKMQIGLLWLSIALLECKLYYLFVNYIDKSHFIFTFSINCA